eukprot:GDKJ01014038.1.p1 GENE.GDKJ01014038.1~~GDKJ01014038.1.p1  ORF type:complete len:318 (-),score=52.76 GDKJ01014038.1:1115-2068(-)
MGRCEYSCRGDQRMSSESALRSLVAQVGRDGKQIPTAAPRKSSQKGGILSSGNASQVEGGFLLPAKQYERDRGKKTLVLDLDETLVHSSFREVPNASFIIPVEIDGTKHNIYVCKRPGVDEFLRQVSHYYECVIFTASLSSYADPLMDLLDPNRVCTTRLFREHCTYYRGAYVKDLTRLGRAMSQVIIIDNSPVAYSFQPDNAIPIRSWFDDPHDRELFDLVPILQALSLVDDLPEVLRATLRNEEDEDLPSQQAVQSQQVRGPITAAQPPSPSRATHGHHAHLQGTTGSGGRGFATGTPVRAVSPSSVPQNPTYGR